MAIRDQTWTAFFSSLRRRNRKPRHTITSVTRGVELWPSSKLTCALYELTDGKADVCKNDDKRKDNPSNLLTSIAATIGISNEETQSLGEGSQQPDGVTAYGHYLDRDEFPIFRRERVPFLVRM